MNNTPASPALSRWRERFATDPVQALGQLLAGSVNLGPYNRARPADALAQLLTRQEEVAQADQALLAWLEYLLGKPAPEGLTGKRFADTLVEAFRTVTHLPLPATRAWLAGRHGDLRAWLRGFYFGPSRDPEAALLLALAHGQPDRSLLGLWLTLVRLTGTAPLQHALLGLTGLRLMPADDQGATEHGLPLALLRGLLELGEALARTDAQKESNWLRELDFLAAVYPMSKEQWGKCFRQVLQARPVSTPVQHWLDQRYPAAGRPATRSCSHGRELRPPHVDELKSLLPQIPKNLNLIRPSLQAILDRHRNYCQESGDSYYLVRTFCNLGGRLLDQDPTWTRELAHEAARWEPGNPHPWSMLARALDREGDWRRAAAVYWHARRRFPQDVQCHSQLAHSLLLHRQDAAAEAVLRQAILLFPDNPVCWTDLAHTLRITERGEKALAVYLDAQQLFPQNSVVANALTDTLIDLGRLDEAQKAMLQAEQVVSPSDINKLRQIRNRLQRALAGESIKLWPFPKVVEGSDGPMSALADITGSDFADAPVLGLATLWRRQDNASLTQKALESLPEGPSRIIETGLWQAATEGWPAAAAWFDTHAPRYAGDGVLRVHRLRAHCRSGETMDWSVERNRYPHLLPVILTEETGKPPRLTLDPGDDDLTNEQRQDIWFSGLLTRENASLRDLAEEDLLAARHLV